MKGNNFRAVFILKAAKPEKKHILFLQIIVQTKREKKNLQVAIVTFLFYFTGPALVPQLAAQHYLNENEFQNYRIVCN